MRESLYGTASKEVLGTFPPKPTTIYTDFPFAPPVVNPATTLQALQAAFGSTRLNEVHAAAERWRWISTESAALADDLHQIASDIAATNEGEAIDASTRTIRDAAQQAQHFSTNAQAMALTVGNLHTIHSYGNNLVNQAIGRTSTIPDPAIKAQAEDAFVKTFTTTLFPPSLTMGVPILRNLMATPPQGGYTHLIPTGMNHAITAAGPNLPKTLRILDTITHNTNSTQPGATNRAHAALNELSSIAPPTTETASTATPTTAGASQLHQPLQAASLHTSQLPGAVGTAQPPRSVVSPLSSPAVLSASSGSGASRSAAGSVQPLGALPHSGISHRHAAAGGPRHSALSAPHTSVKSGSGSTPAPMAQRSRGLLAPGAPAAPHQSPVASSTPRGVSSPSTTVLGNTATNSKPTAARTPGAGGFAPTHNRSAKPKGKGPIVSVLAPEEKDANKRALIGKQTPRIAGPIGTWARHASGKSTSTSTKHNQH
ncbi:hypothetical protein [Corynebacterium ciconiae]|uniref:hypothetical protein n=1 Tax=Corynebacterium ciconiae TaxID=227319 RepID=UPI00035C5F21|nr:hypothetical protein [Corynebacterium ciconiae]